MKTDISIKIKKYIPQTYFDHLPEKEQHYILKITEQAQFTFQEFRHLVEAARDLQMWGGKTFSDCWTEQITFGLKRQNKDEALNKFKTYYSRLRATAKEYTNNAVERPKKREKGKIVLKQSDKNIFGMCPVASEKTVCCNLKTIDAVENCVFGCSYCTIQTFYNDKTEFDANFAEKLGRIELDPQKRYHIGTGQSSDSLVWGNRNDNLAALFEFAQKNSNVLLEFKTKSDNIRYFIENDVPANIVCSWSLNPQTVIENEEHFTASLEKRLSAAKIVSDKGVKVSFHFHPMIYYKNWQNAYREIAETVQNTFNPQDILFISFGSITFIKPVLKQIRKLGFPTKITQMELVTDPHGKMTYPDEIKIEKFSTMYQAFSKWHEQVFFYLCMEKASIWEKSLGFVYPDNDTFEKDFLDQTMKKVYQNSLVLS